MASLYISDEDETAGAPNDPKPNNKSRFHTGASLSSDQEIRRVSEQTSPQVARAAGLPAKRDEGGRLISGSRSTCRFPFLGMVFFRGGANGKDRESGP